MTSSAQLEMRIAYYCVHTNFVYTYTLSQINRYRGTKQGADDLMADAESYVTDYEKMALANLVSEEELIKPTYEIISGLSGVKFLAFISEISRQIHIISDSVDAELTKREQKLGIRSDLHE